MELYFYEKTLKNEENNHFLQKKLKNTGDLLLT